MRISDWSSDVCSSDLKVDRQYPVRHARRQNDRRRLQLALAEREGVDPAPRGAAADRDVEHALARGVLCRFEEMERHAVAAVGDGNAIGGDAAAVIFIERSEEHTSELQSLMRISYAVFCLKKKKEQKQELNSIKSTKHNK